MVSSTHFTLWLGLISLSSHAGAFSINSFSQNVLDLAFVKNDSFAREKRTRILMSSAAPEADSVESKLVRLPNSAVEVTITATPSQTRSVYDKTISELSKQMSIPGFRKGSKIPANVIENAVAAKNPEGKNAVRSKAINTLLGDMVEHAIKTEHNLTPIGQPVLTVKTEALAEQFQPGETLEMTVRCDVWPDLNWHTIEGQEKAYFGLKGRYKRKPFNQERFDAALNDLRDRHATLEPMEGDDAALSMGDACVVNMEGFLANTDGSKGDPLPNAASGDNVEIVLGAGRYMEGLVEGLIGAKVGDTRTVTVSFPEKLRDKNLAGKRAIFDVDVLKASHRKLPELNDEFAEKVRPDLTLEKLKAELRKAVDEEDAKEFVDERNEALSKALAEVVDIEVPDTVVTQQAKQKYAEMMTDLKDSGMADEDLKKQITPENFLKFKDIYADGIEKEFKVSAAVDEIGKIEGIEVPANQVDEQVVQLRKKAEQEGAEFDANTMRSQVEATLQRRMVFDFLAERAKLEVEYAEDEEFDEALMEKLARDSLEREEIAAEEATAAAADSVENTDKTEKTSDANG